MRTRLQQAIGFAAPIKAMDLVSRHSLDRRREGRDQGQDKERYQGIHGIKYS
jgi:hypothetical protein